MSPNRNYLSGRRFEYEVMEDLRSKGYETVRTAGSHGTYDVIGFRPQHPPEFIQCKVTEKESEAKRLVEEFKENTVASKYYHQSIRVKIKGSKESMNATI